MGRGRYCTVDECVVVVVLDGQSAERNMKDVRSVLVNPSIKSR